MRKGLVLLIFVFVTVIFCMSNVQASTGSNYSIDSYVNSTGVADSHPASISVNNNDVKDGTVLAKNTKPKKKEKKPKKEEKPKKKAKKKEKK